MNPSRLKDRITVRELTQTADAEGTVIDTYTDAFKRYAEVRPTRGREPYVNDQFLDQIDYVVSMRFDGETRDITAKHEVTFKGNRLRIIGSPINVENRDQEIRLFCTRFADGR